MTHFTGFSGDFWGLAGTIAKNQNKGFLNNINDIKAKSTPFGVLFSTGGRWWIRTTEVIDDRFTVCSLWPLGKPPI